MDIHANHLHKAPGQKFWHYFFEFLMLFLAVFCGFMAEYRLEHRIERDRENEFVTAAVNEMKINLYWIQKFESDSNRYKYLDTLAMLLVSGDRTQSTIRKICSLWPSIFMGWEVQFKNTTLTQLKNSGNLRLIQNRGVADSLIGLDASISHSEIVLEELRKIVYDNNRMAAKIFDLKYFLKDNKWIWPFDTAFDRNATIRLLTNNEALLNEFGYSLEIQSFELRNYNNAIQGHKIYTTRLINFFKKEYHLTDS